MVIVFLGNAAAVPRLFALLEAHDWVTLASDLLRTVNYDQEPDDDCRVLIHHTLVFTRQLLRVELARLAASVRSSRMGTQPPSDMSIKPMSLDELSAMSDIMGLRNHAGIFPTHGA